MLTDAPRWLWHGADWTFVVWGAIHGGMLGAERWVKERWRAAHAEPVLPPELTVLLQWLLTFHVVCLGWVFFRSDSVGHAFDVLRGIVAGSGPSPLVTTLVLVVIALAVWPASSCPPPPSSLRSPASPWSDPGCRCSP